MAHGLGNDGFLVTKTKLKSKGFNDMVRIPFNEQSNWQTYKNPKLMHHIDGTAQISGTNIRSGFYKNSGRPKGLYVDSMDLKLNDNDGGPIFSYFVWGLDKFRKKIIKRGKTIKINDADIIRDPHYPPKDKPGIVVEGFYIDKRNMKFLNLSSSNFSFPHPNYGVVPLKYIPGKKECHGILALFCRETNSGFDSDYGVSVGGGLGKRYPDGSWEELNYIYPLSIFKENNKKFKTIEYTGIYKFFNFIDSAIFKIKRKFLT